MSNITSKYTNHTKEEIEKYLRNTKKNIIRGNFIVCTTRKNKKNREFIEKYRLNSNIQKQMLIQLEAKDFCYSADNYNYPHEKLYFFCKEYELSNWGKVEKNKVYIKIANKRNNFIVVVSFHKPEKDIEKLFL